MSCLFHLFSKNASAVAPQGPKLPPIPEGIPKPTFCIYDSDESESPVQNVTQPSQNEFPLLDSFQLLKHNPMSLPQFQDGFNEVNKEQHTIEALPKSLACYPFSTISNGYQDIYLADTFFVYLSLDEQDPKSQEQEKKSNLSYALLQIETEKSEMNFDKSLPFIPQSKFPKIRKFSASTVPYSGPEGQTTMGNSDSKISFQRAVEQLGSPDPVEAGDVAVWDQLCQESLTSIQDVFSLLPAEEIRKLREDSPTNLSILCYKVT
jgi:hypothetical protein